MKEKAPAPKTPPWPWWEPYVFTAGLSVCLILLIAMLGYAVQIPGVELAMFAFMTMSSLAAAIRQSRGAPSVVSNLLLAVFFAVAVCGSYSEQRVFYAVGYGVLTGIWICLAVMSLLARRRLARERLERLDGAVELLRRAVKPTKP